MSTSNAKIGDNSRHFLTTAATLIKGEISQQSEVMAGAKEARDKAMWQATCNLVCYAAMTAFAKGYSRKLAVAFAEELAETCGIKQKQAEKYTSSISLALGVRMGKSKTMKESGIKGLRAAAISGVEDVVELFKAQPEPIDSLGALMRALRKDKDKVQEAAERFVKWSDEEQAEFRDAVARLEKVKEQAVKAAAKTNAKANSVAHASA